MGMVRKLRRNERGAAVIEMAFALPVLILFLWMIVQAGLMLRAMSGIQHGLGEGARFATLYPKPTDKKIHDRIEAAVYGIGPGKFTIYDPVPGTADGASYIDLRVKYTQSSDMLFFPGPDISVTRRKRVWVAS